MIYVFLESVESADATVVTAAPASRFKDLAQKVSIFFLFHTFVRLFRIVLIVDMGILELFFPFPNW